MSAMDEKLRGLAKLVGDMEANFMLRSLALSALALVTPFFALFRALVSMCKWTKEAAVYAAQRIWDCLLLLLILVASPVVALLSPIAIAVVDCRDKHGMDAALGLVLTIVCLGNLCISTWAVVIGAAGTFDKCLLVFSAIGLYAGQVLLEENVK